MPQLVDEIVVAERRAAAGDVDDLRAVGGEGGVGVLAGDARQLPGRPSGVGHRPDVPALGVVPGDERERPAVTRERRGVFEIAERRHAPRGSGGEAHRVQVPERREDQALSVPRLDRPADDPCRDVIDADTARRAQRLRERLLDLRSERDPRTCAAGIRVPPDLPVGGGDDPRAVGCPRVPGKDAVEAESLLIVPLQSLGDRADLPAREVHHLEDRLRPDPADVRHAAPVGGDRRGRRPAELTGDRDGLSVPPVEPLDLPDPLVDVAVVPVARVAGGEEDEPPVLRERRVGRVRLLVLLGQLDPAAAADVPHPQLDGAEGGAVGQPLAADEVQPVRGPGGGIDEGVLLRRHRARVCAGAIADPEVLRPAAVGGERDLRAVRRKAPLHVVRGAARDARRLAPGRGERVEVAVEREHDRRPVGAHVEGQPGRLVGLKRDRVRRAVARVDLPLGIVRRRLGGLVLGGFRRGRGIERTRDRQRQGREQGEGDRMTRGHRETSRKDGRSD